MWIIICSQLFEVVAYIHYDAHIWHNDIKADNILLTEDQDISHCKYQVILSDFGKATPISSGRQYNFSEPEKVQYLTKYPHVASEVVHGESKQTTLSDMYAVSVFFYKLLDHNCFSSCSQSLRKDFSSLFTKCRAVDFCHRTSAKQCIRTLKCHN